MPRSSPQDKANVWYCCHCRSGPLSWSLYNLCLDCDHHRCGNCIAKSLKASTVDRYPSASAGRYPSASVHPNTASPEPLVPPTPFVSSTSFACFWAKSDPERHVECASKQFWTVDSLWRDHLQLHCRQGDISAGSLQYVQRYEPHMNMGKPQAEQLKWLEKSWRWSFTTIFPAYSNKENELDIHYGAPLLKAEVPLTDEHDTPAAGTAHRSVRASIEGVRALHQPSDLDARDHVESSRPRSGSTNSQHSVSQLAPPSLPPTYDLQPKMVAQSPIESTLESPHPDYAQRQAVPADSKHLIGLYHLDGPITTIVDPVLKWSQEDSLYQPWFSHGRPWTDRHNKLGADIDKFLRRFDNPACDWPPSRSFSEPLEPSDGANGAKKASLSGQSTRGEPRRRKDHEKHLTRISELAGGSNRPRCMTGIIPRPGSRWHQQYGCHIYKDNPNDGRLSECVAYCSPEEREVRIVSYKNFLFAATEPNADKSFRLMSTSTSRKVILETRPILLSCKQSWVDCRSGYTSSSLALQSGNATRPSGRRLWPCFAANTKQPNTS